MHHLSAAGRPAASRASTRAGAGRRLVRRRALQLSPAARPYVAAGLVASLLAYTALTPLSPFARDIYGSELRRHVIFGAVTAGYALSLAITTRLPRPTALDVPIAGIVLAALISTVRSLDPRVSAEWLLLTLPIVPVYLILADDRLITPAAIRRGVMIAGSAVALFALGSAWRQWSEWLTLVRAIEGGLGWSTLLPPAVPRVEGVGSHPNVAGAVLALTLPFTALTAVEPSRLERLVGRFAAAVIVAGLFFTLSRAAWAAAALGVGVTAAGLAWSARWRPGRRPERWLAAAAAVLVLLVLLSAALGNARPDWLFRDSLNPRADMRRAGVEIFRDNPLTGAGAGLYVSLYPTHGGAFPFAAVHSHNVAVQVAADHGLIGLAAGLILLATTGALLVSRYRSTAPETRRLAALGAGVVVAFLVHGLADSPHLFPEVWLLLAAAIAPLAVRRSDRRQGALSSNEREDPQPDAVAASPGSEWRRLRVAGTAIARAGSPLLSCALLLVGLALIPAWWYSDHANAAYQRSVDASLHQRPEEAVRQAEIAMSRDPRLAAYQFQLGSLRTSRYYDTRDLTERDAAIRAYESGLAREPRNGAALVDLAALRIDAGDIEGAWAALDQLRHVAGRDNLLQLAYAVLVQSAGTPEQAVDTYGGLLAINPTLAVTPFFQSDDFRREHYQAIVDRALERAEEITGPGAAADGLRTAIRVLTGRDAPREQDLQANLATAPDDVSLDVALGRLLTAGGELDEAGPLLRRAVARKGDSPDAHAALGDWYAARGETASARREWLRAAYLGDVAAMDRLGESFPTGRVPTAVIQRQTRLVESAAITRFYLPFQSFRFTFLRHEPVPIISLGDWLNALPTEFDRWRSDLQKWQDDRK